MLSTLETMVWLVRHGLSTFNLQRRCQGCCDLPELTEAGRQSARLTGTRLRQARVEAIISSPLRRAAQTAFEIKDELAREIPLELDARLREIELPQWEGLPLAEIPRRFPEQFLNWRIQPWRLSMPSPHSTRAFPVRSLYQRVREFWRDLLDAYCGRSVVLVTHGGTGRALVTTAVGLGAQHFQSIQQSNCAVSRLRFSPGYQEAQLELLNDTAHLGTRLPKLKGSKTGTQLLLIPAVDSDATDLRRIASLLEHLSVDTVVAAGAVGPSTASLILPRYVRECIQQVPEEFLGRCAQQAVDNGNRRSLRHVVLVAPAACLRHFLQQQLNLSSAAERMAFASGGITAIHHPDGGEPPVLQALIMFKPEFSLAGVPL